MDEIKIKEFVIDEKTVIGDLIENMYKSLKDTHSETMQRIMDDNSETINGIQNFDSTPRQSEFSRKYYFLWLAGIIGCGAISYFHPKVLLKKIGCAGVTILTLFGCLIWYKQHKQSQQLPKGHLEMTQLKSKIAELNDFVSKHKQDKLHLWEHVMKNNLGLS